MSNYTLIGRSLVASLQSLPLGESAEFQLCHPTRVGEDAQAWNPHVILMEATVDFAEAISTLSALSNAIPSARIVLLGRESDEATVYEAILSGASGYLRADASVEMLANTLKGVAQGELGLTRQDARQVVHHLRQAARARTSHLLPEVEDSLTPREQEVFELVRRGLRSREIAQQLTIADATVYKHIQNILEKLRVHSRTQAIFMSRTPGSGIQDPPIPPRRALS
ncbi:MAG: LuxR C-terminal-related transcriptional regulator [Ktedonobacterales bacterium]